MGTLRPQYVLLPDYTQTEEDVLALTLPAIAYDRIAVLWNTTISKGRYWNGTAFVSVPLILSTVMEDSIQPLLEYQFSGAINGQNAVFTTSVNFNSSRVFVFLNGVRQKVVDDYQLSNNNTITFVASPLTGEKIVVVF